MQKLFYHSYTYATDKTAFPHDINKAPLDTAVTFHPLKTPELMHELHQELMLRGRAAQQVKLSGLEQEVSKLENLIGTSI